MAHGDKKWIKDYRGHYKKSNDRTQKDWRGKHVRGWHYVRDKCETCQSEAAELSVQPHRYRCENCLMENDLIWSRRMLGVKAHYQWSIRQDVRLYRKAVRDYMAREDYDNIPRYRRGWYD